MWYNSVVDSICTRDNMCRGAILLLVRYERAISISLLFAGQQKQFL